MQETLNAAGKHLTDAGNVAMAGMVGSATELLFGMDNNLKGKFVGGIDLAKTIAVAKTVDGHHQDKKVTVDVEVFSLTVDAKDTKIPLSLFAKSLVMADGAAAVVEGGAISQQTWETARTNAVLLSGTVDVYKVEDLNVVGNLLSLIGTDPKSEQYKTNMRAQIGNEIAVSWFDGLVAFIQRTENLIIKWTTKVPETALQHLLTKTVDEKARDKESDAPFPVITECTIEKDAIKIGGYFLYQVRRREEGGGGREGGREKIKRDCRAWGRVCVCEALGLWRQLRWCVCFRIGIERR